eukprot:gnl/MRDRNA2_/MRDRNA2_34742_c0_seq1.p1 gnl/MRDRNA2_/MRDRNA2_34742_c0~~gnl/MRDRNA2_/MRDRNA2_34742_c0_seq1.p1  ORF type:complete len:287 (+),score=76.60 gnl/MRDRNA2_/MRDRNA2_34742_c0_seq1:50-862(+)
MASAVREERYGFSSVPLQPGSEEASDAVALFFWQLHAASVAYKTFEGCPAPLKSVSDLRWPPTALCPSCWSRCFRKQRLCWDPWNDGRVLAKAAMPHEHFGDDALPNNKEVSRLLQALYGHAAAVPPSHTSKPKVCEMLPPTPFPPQPLHQPLPPTPPRSSQPPVPPLTSPAAVPAPAGVQASPPESLEGEKQNFKASEEAEKAAMEAMRKAWQEEAAEEKAKKKAEEEEAKRRLEEAEAERERARQRERLRERQREREREREREHTIRI